MHLMSRHRACARKTKQGSIAILIGSGTLEDFRTAFSAVLVVLFRNQQSIENIGLTSDREIEIEHELGKEKEM